MKPSPSKKAWYGYTFGHMLAIVPDIKIFNRTWSTIEEYENNSTAKKRHIYP
jgi:hypothetical protein